MQRLNIPLKSGGQTTRQRRRVVWPLIGVMVAGLFAFCLVRILLGRATLLWIGPSDAMVVDVVGRGSLEQIENHLGNSTIFDGKPLTLNNLAPFVHGEVALALLPTGGRVFAYRGVLPDPLRTTISTYGVRLVSDAGGVVILSDADTTGMNLNGGLRLSLSSILPSFGGVAREGHQLKTIFLGSTGISVGNVANQADPKDMAGFLAWIQLDSSTIPLFPTYEPLAGYGLLASIPDLLGSGTGTVLLTTDSDGIGFRIQVNHAIESQKLADLLNKSVALNEPSTVPLSLIDGSSIDELRSDPDLIKTSVQDLGQQGTLITVDGSSAHLAARSDGHATIITNRPSLLDAKSPFPTGVSVIKIDALAALSASEVGTADIRTSLLSSVREIDIDNGNFAIRW